MKRLHALFLMSVLVAVHLSADEPSGLRIITSDTTPDRSVAHDFNLPPQTSDGWTDFEAIVQNGYEDARVVFVSASEGDDASGEVYGISAVGFDSDGMFQSAVAEKAYASIPAAYAQVRDGYPDIILLKRGDEWVEQGFTSGSAGGIKSGRTNAERHIIASYGTGQRPQLRNGSTISFDAYNEDYVIVSGIRSYTADWLIARRAIDVRGYSTNILFEDLKVDRHAGGIFQGGELQDIALRRCIFTEHEAHDGMFFATKSNGLLFEESIFYKPYDDHYPDESRYGRVFYLSAGNGVNVNELFNLELRGNIIAASEREAIDCRSGGTIDNNLILQADLRFGGVGGSAGSTVSGSITNNVFTQSSENLRKPSILRVINPVGVVISGNVWTDPRLAEAATNAIIISAYDSEYAFAKDLRISENIIHDWKVSGQASRPIWFYNNLENAATGDIANVSVFSNDIQQTTGTTEVIAVPSRLATVGSFYGNRYYATIAEDEWFSPGGDLAGWIAATGETAAEATRVSYSAPSRTIDSYDRNAGGAGSTEHFIAEALQQSRQNWRPAYTAGAANNYIRAGFGKPPIY